MYISLVLFRPKNHRNWSETGIISHAHIRYTKAHTHCTERVLLCTAQKARISFHTNSLFLSLSSALQSNAFERLSRWWLSLKVEKEKRGKDRTAAPWRIRALTWPINSSGSRVKMLLPGAYYANQYSTREFGSEQDEATLTRTKEGESEKLSLAMASRLFGLPLLLYEGLALCASKNACRYTSRARKLYHRTTERESREWEIEWTLWKLL